MGSLTMFLGMLSTFSGGLGVDKRSIKSPKTPNTSGEATSIEYRKYRTFVICLSKNPTYHLGELMDNF